MCQMAFDEGYRDNNPIRSIRLKHASARPVLVASDDQWWRLEEAMTYPPARLYARLNVTTWARRSSPIPADDDEHLPPLVSKAGVVYEHGTKGGRYSMDCHCMKCKAYAADYQRQWRRQQRTQRASTEEPVKANSWRRDGTEFLMAEVWLRFWNAARDAASLPQGFTPYNARHTGISWAIDKGVDLQKVRQRAGHGSLEVTSRYAAILDERDTSLADTLEEIFDRSRPAVSRHENTTEFDDAAGLLSIGPD
jgi:hypothetical protein